MKEMMILLHSRGNSQALHDLEDFSNVIYLNKLNVVSRYDLSLKAERKVSNCNPDRSQTHECLKKFIASQMNCTTKWENKYFLYDKSVIDDTFYGHFCGPKLFLHFNFLHSSSSLLYLKKAMSWICE